MSGRPEPKVLLMTLSQRTSGKGNAYLSGWLGKASVVAFPGEADKFGNATWDLFVSPAPPRQQPSTAGGPRSEFFYTDGAHAHARENSR